ncbi:MAG: helix-hairpin-helix domain-containing protein [Bacteroidales bacterium]|nr:helix-hairpin-helix domain-containing protein [Bacteroidales bacterium]
MNFRCFFAATGLFFCVASWAQHETSPDLYNLREWVLESMPAEDGISADFETILNELEQLQAHPLDLNNASTTDLQKLFFLTDFQIASILKYRKEMGPLLTIYELQLVYGFTQDVINRVLPFVYVDDRETSLIRKAGVKKAGNHDLLIKTRKVFEEIRGYQVYDSSAGQMQYPGSPWLLHLRYGFEWKEHVRAGVTLEKDPGEEFFRGSNRHGFDYNSAFVMGSNMKFIKSAIVGDYRLAFGQGLVLWNGTAPGKSSLTLGIVKRQHGLKPYSSTDENNFFRGVAATTSLGKADFTGFFSFKKRDANIIDTLESGDVVFSSFQESGYHRTHSEVSDEKTLGVTVYGGNISYRNNYLKAGSTLACYHFNKLAAAGDEPEDLYDFSGNGLVNWGIDYSLIVKKVQVFGEAATGNDHWAFVNGLLLNVNKYATFSLLYRNLSPGYISMNSSVFCENSSQNNEEGFYAGVVLHPVPKISISGYVDFYRFPWLKTNLSAPASGSDYLLQVDFKATKKTAMYLRLKYKRNPADAESGTQIPDIANDERSGIRYHVNYRAGRSFTMQNRIEMVFVQAGSAKASTGFMVYHDVRFESEQLHLVVDARLAWFNTGDYSARIYAYEHDLSTGFSFTPLYDSGLRSYIMVRYNLSENLSFRVRLSNTYFSNRQEISSGWDRINNPTRTDLKLQLALKF